MQAYRLMSEEIENLWDAENKQTNFYFPVKNEYRN